MSFRELVAEMDGAVFGDLADDGTIDGRPVRGMFASPWLGPQVGHLNTSIVEPRFTVLDADVGDAASGSIVVHEGATYDVMCVEPDGSGVTALILRPAS